MKRTAGMKGIFALSALSASLVLFFAVETPQSEAGWGSRGCAPVGAFQTGNVGGFLPAPLFQQPFQLYSPALAAAAPAAPAAYCEGWYQDGPAAFPWNCYLHGTRTDCADGKGHQWKLQGDGTWQREKHCTCPGEPCCGCGCANCKDCKQTGKPCCDKCGCHKETGASVATYVYGADYSKIHHGEITMGGVPVKEGEFNALIGDTPPNDIQKFYICAVGDDSFLAAARSKYATLANKDSFLFGGYSPTDWQAAVGFTRHQGNGIAILGPRDQVSGKAKELSWTTSVDKLDAEAAGALRVPDPLYDPNKTPDLAKPAPKPPEPTPAPVPASPTSEVTVVDLLLFTVPLALIGLLVAGAGVFTYMLRRRNV